jgi:TRAP-type C4-dicarboxylate transport system substrate-binding protein
MLIDRRAFSKIRPDDQAVVREVMEGLYRKFDQNGVNDNDEAMQALLEGGIEMTPTDAAQADQWRGLVLDSHRKLGRQGVFDIELLEQMQGLLVDYRAGQGTK